MLMATVSDLARRFSAEQLEECLQAEIDVGSNACLRNETAQEVVTALTEAEFVREQVERGIPLSDAVRHLARRIRALQGAHKRQARDFDRRGLNEPQWSKVIGSSGPHRSLRDSWRPAAETRLGEPGFFAAGGNLQGLPPHQDRRREVQPV
jgi:hypothetical protein